VHREHICASVRRAAATCRREVWQLTTAPECITDPARGYQKRVHGRCSTSQKAWDRWQTCRANRKAQQHDWLDSVNFVAINPDQIHWRCCKGAKSSSS
jgi:hypothetical protein